MAVMFTIKMTVDGVLLAGRWRTEKELAAMSKEDHRNTLIVELTGHTSHSREELWGLGNEQLVELGAVAVFLLESAICTREQLQQLTDSQRTRRVAELLSAYAGTKLEELLRLRGRELVERALPWLGRLDPACEGNLSNPVESSPVVEGDYVYFVGGPERNALYRRRKADADPLRRAVRLADHCTSTPCVDSNWVYFRSSDNSLLRCAKDKKQEPERLATPCFGSPYVRDGYVYFRGGRSETSLSRIRIGGQGPQRVEHICDDCHGSPFVDEGYVYFVGGSSGRALMRCVVSGTQPAHVIDENGAGRPFVDGRYVYFGGGSGRDQLFKRAKDGSEKARLLDDRFAGSPFVSGRYVYFLGGGKRDALFRRDKEGNGAAECIFERCGGSTFVDGEHAYFAATPEGSKPALFRRRCPDKISSTVRHKQWMKDAWNAIKDRPLWQIAMVGAHDAGSYGLWWDGVVEHAIVALKSGSKTQGASLYRQLEFGIRYFDLRFFSPRGGEPDLSRWYINHGSDISTVTLEEVLADIARFVQETSHEILIVDARSDVMDVRPYGIASAAQQAFVIDSFIRRIGREHFVTRTQVRHELGKAWPASCTPAELARSGMNTVATKVILLWQCPIDLEESVELQFETKNCFWTQRTPGVGGTREDAEYCQITRHGEDIPAQMAWWETQGRQLQQRSHGRFFWRPSFPSGSGWIPETRANDSLPGIITNLRDAWRSYPWNLLNVDSFTPEQYEDFVDAVVKLNTYEGRFKY